MSLPYSTAFAAVFVVASLSAQTPITIDGVDTDWRLITTGWKDDPKDHGGSSQDLKEFKLASDAQNLYYYFKMEAPFFQATNPSPPPRLFIKIDKDTNYTNGQSGSGMDIEIEVIGSGASSSCNSPISGCNRVRRFTAPLGLDASNFGSWSPKYSHHGKDWIEGSLPLSELQLATGQTIRFRVMVDGGDSLRGAPAFSSPLVPQYTLGREIAIDGFKDDWDNIRTSWGDGTNPDSIQPSRDLRMVKLHSDAHNLYFFFQMAGGFSTAPYPAIVLDIDTDTLMSTGQPNTSNGIDVEFEFRGASSTNTRDPNGWVYRRRFGVGGYDYVHRGLFKPDSPNHGRDWSEFAVPLYDLGLVPGRIFRFKVKSKSVPDGSGFFEDFLLEDVPMNAVRLYYPGETVHIGAVMVGVHTDNLRMMRDMLMDCTRTFRQGRYYHVQLAVSTEQGTQVFNPDDQTGLRMFDPRIPPTAGRYNFKRLNATCSTAKVERIPIFPIMDYHTGATDFDQFHYNTFKYKDYTIQPPDSFSFWPRIRTWDQREVPMGFMAWIPGSGGDTAWAGTATRRAVKEMCPYLGDVVRMIFTGNEVTYSVDDSTFGSYDPIVTRRDFGSSLPGRDDSDRPFGIFRSRKLVQMLKSWTDSARVEAQQVPVSTKLVPTLISDDGIRRAGYFPGIYDYLADEGIPSIASDPYPLATDKFQMINRFGKSAVWSEYAGDKGSAEYYPCNETVARETRSGLIAGLRDYKVRSAFYYKWEDGGFGLRECPANLNGIRNAIDSILSAPKAPVKNRALVGLLPLNLLRGNNIRSGLVSEDGIQRISRHTLRFILGFSNVAQEIQRNSNFDFEFDYTLRDRSPDAAISILDHDTTLHIDKLLSEPRIYFLSKHLGNSPDPVLNISGVSGPHYVTVRGSDSFDGLATSLVRNFDAEFDGDTVFNGSQQWKEFNNQYLVMNLPTFTTSSTLPDTLVRATQIGKPVMVAIGNRCVIASADLLYAAGPDTVKSQHLHEGKHYANAIGFMTKLLKRVAEGSL